MSVLDRFRPLSADDKDRIRAEIVAACAVVGECWVYPDTTPLGYGTKYIQGRMRPTSRFMLAYETRESLDKNANPYDACHIKACTSRACCRPTHLFWGTHGENCMTRERKRKLRKLLGAMTTAIAGQEATDCGCLDRDHHPESEPMDMPLVDYLMASDERLVLVDGSV